MANKILQADPPIQTTNVRSANRAVYLILFAAVAAIIICYAASMMAVQAIQESQDLSQAMLIAADEMEVDTVSGALRVYQYLETGDPHFRTAYQQHSSRFRQYADRFLALARFKEWQETGRLIAKYFGELDKISLDVMSNRDRMQTDTAAVLAELGQLANMTGTRLHEGGSPGSPAYALNGQMASALAALRWSLADFLRKGGDAGAIAAQVNALRTLVNAHAKLPLSESAKKAFSGFASAVESLGPAINQLLQTAAAQRTGVARMMELQQLITATRIRPTLKRHSEDGASRADAQMTHLLYFAGAASLLLCVAAVLAARHVRRVINRAAP